MKYIYIYIYIYIYLIDSRFTNEFIIESITFILKNNNFLFDNIMYNQCIGTAMGHIFAPPYACLSVGYLEEDKLFTTELNQRFDRHDIDVIEKSFKRYMDDGSTFLPPSIDCEMFLKCLNILHPSIEYALEPAIKTTIDEKSVYKLNFLDITIILHEDGKIETDIHYKPTNSHKYLNYESFHPTHCKNNIPFTLAKRIIVFVTNPVKMELRLKELISWLVNCNYPLKIINKGIHNARLQGPANKPRSSNNVIPFVTTLMSNLDAKPIINSIRTLLSTTKSNRLREVFKDVNIVLGYKQPKNFKGLLTHAKYGETIVNERNAKIPGIFANCTDKRCMLCSLGYMQNVTCFEIANGTIWNIKNHINCNTNNVIYYLKCQMCDGKTTYTGITKLKLRMRMNNHITCCRNGSGTNIFDNHVFKCGTLNNCLKPPYFQIYAFMRVSSEEKLITYERYLHRTGSDTMNK